MENYWKKSLWTTIIIGLTCLGLTYLWIGQIKGEILDCFFPISVVSYLTLMLAFCIYRVDREYCVTSPAKILSFCGVSFALAFRLTWAYLLRLNDVRAKESLLLFITLLAITLFLNAIFMIILLRQIIKREKTSEISLGRKRNERNRNVKSLRSGKIVATFLVFLVLQALVLWPLPNVFFFNF